MSNLSLLADQELQSSSIAVEAEAQHSSASLLMLEEMQSLSSTTAAKSTPSTRSWGSLGVFGSTFLTIFLAELGDKTQIATLLMSAESHAPWVVFAGAAGALVATSLIGVLLGRWLSTRLSPRTLDVAAGITLLLVSGLLVWDVIQS